MFMGAVCSKAFAVCLWLGAAGLQGARCTVVNESRQRPTRKRHLQVRRFAGSAGQRVSSMLLNDEHTHMYIYIYMCDVLPDFQF